MSIGPVIAALLLSRASAWERAMAYIGQLERGGIRSHPHDPSRDPLVSSEDPRSHH